MISILNNSDKGLIETLVNKDATANEFINLCKCIEEEKSFPRHLNLLIKAAEGFENIETSHLKNIADAVKKLINKYDKINIAFTVSHQRELKLSLIFENLIITDDYQFKVFSNTKDATRWLRQSSLNRKNYIQKSAS